MGKVSKYVKQLKRRDRSLDSVYLAKKHITLEDLDKLVYYLLRYPNVVSHINLALTNLCDVETPLLALYLAASSTIVELQLAFNQLGTDAYLTIAATLHLNTSMQSIFMYGNQEVDKTRVDAAFVNALRLNPIRSCHSNWQLYATSNDFNRLKDAAEKSTPPSALEFLLCIHLDTEKIEPKIH